MQGFACFTAAERCLSSWWRAGVAITRRCTVRAVPCQPPFGTQHNLALPPLAWLLLARLPAWTRCRLHRARVLGRPALPLSFGLSRGGHLIDGRLYTMYTDSGWQPSGYWACRAHNSVHGSSAALECSRSGALAGFCGAADVSPPFSTSQYRLVALQGQPGSLRTLSSPTTN